MREPPTGRYRDADGNRHELSVRERADGGWHVLDSNVDTKTAHVVDELTSDQDGRPQAEAIALDYLTTVDRMHKAGPAAGEPIPEQGGTDARSDRRSHPAPRVRRPRGAALSRPAS